MALTRKFLSALGIEADKVDEIINAHAETVNALKEERDNYKADAEKLPAVQKELDELKKSGGDPYEDRYNNLKKEYDDYKAEVKAKADKAAKVAAYKDLLKDAGIPEKRLDAIIKVSDLESIELADGKIKGESELKESLKKEWADFIPSTTTTGTADRRRRGKRSMRSKMRAKDRRLLQTIMNSLVSDQKGRHHGIRSLQHC